MAEMIENEVNSLSNELKELEQKFKVNVLYHIQGGLLSSVRMFHSISSHIKVDYSVGFNYGCFFLMTRLKL